MSEKSKGREKQEEHKKQKKQNGKETKGLVTDSKEEGEVSNKRRDRKE